MEEEAMRAQPPIETAAVFGCVLYRWRRVIISKRNFRTDLRVLEVGWV